MWSKDLKLQWSLCAFSNTLHFWCRAVGHAAFRNKLLERYGTVVTIPYKSDNTTVKSMARDIKAAVQAMTGLPLDSFRL